MRAFVCIAMLMGGCASNLPPELRDPTGHVRPVERGELQTPVFVPDLVVEAAQLEGAAKCEMLRRAAQDGERGAQNAFGLCVLEQGEAGRAYAVLENSASSIREVAGILSGALDADEIALNRAIARAPNDARLWNLLGREYERQGRDAEAIDAYLRAKQLG
jgi:tetratricopeptide (TPR) repeat protein